MNYDRRWRNVLCCYKSGELDFWKSWEWHTLSGCWWPVVPDCNIVGHLLLGVLDSHSMKLKQFSSVHSFCLNTVCTGTTDDFTTSFLLFSLFSTVLWDLANSRSFHSLMMSSRLFFCLPFLSLPPSCALQYGFGQIWWTGDYVNTTSVFVSLWWWGLSMIQLHAGSWHRLLHW